MIEITYNGTDRPQSLLALALERHPDARLSWRDTEDRDAEVMAAHEMVSHRRIGYIPTCTQASRTPPLDSGTRRHGTTPELYYARMNTELRAMRAKRKGVKVERSAPATQRPAIEVTYSGDL